MLARSTASRHGEGRTCRNATSIRIRWPSDTSRLAGLMSRCATPASQRRRTSPRPSSMIASSTTASVISCEPSKNCGEEQVLPLGGELDDPTGRGGRDAEVLQEPEGVVLVLDEPSDRLEGGLVLEAPVEDRPSELVPAVRPDVVHGIELPEQVRVGVTRHPDPERRRAAGSGQADGFDVDDREAELVLDGAPQRLAPPAPHIEVGGLPASVRDREDIVRGEEPEGVQQDRHGEGHADNYVERMLHAQVQLRGGEDDGDARSPRPWRSSVAGRERPASSRPRRRRTPRPPPPPPASRSPPTCR